MIDLSKVTKTRAGYEVLWAGYFPENNADRKIIAIVKGSDGVIASYYREEGRRINMMTPSDIDLIEDKKEITKWFNVFEDHESDDFYVSDTSYDSEMSAKQDGMKIYTYIKAIPVTVEV